MRRILVIATLITLACITTLTAFAEDLITLDVKGLKDPPGIKRVQDSVLVLGDDKAFDEYTIPLEKVEFDYSSQSFKPWKRIKAEGSRHTAFYRMPKDVSTLEPLRSYESELKDSGYEVIFEGGSEDLDNGYGRFVEQVYGKAIGAPLMQYIVPAARDFRYIAMKKTLDSGVIRYFTGLFIKVPDQWASKFGAVNDVLGRVDLIETKPLTKRLVLVKAEEMAQELGANGKVSLYGILFDFNKAEIKPESESTLVEIAKFLSTNPKQKVLVVGHTDNKGLFEFNRELSQRRAQAVVEYLVSKYSIARDRLLPFGASFSSPIASNETEEGMAKNRRVELVAY